MAFHLTATFLTLSPNSHMTAGIVESEWIVFRHLWSSMGQIAGRMIPTTVAERVMFWQATIHFH